jgi:DinB superfamily
MPIPADPVDTSDVASTVLTLFGQVHDQIRAEIEGLDADGLNWTPGPGTNSIATIITHLVGSEAETIRSVAGTVDHRDRDAEFVQPRQTVADLADALHRADRLIVEMGPQIDSGRLRARLGLPTLPDDERRSGLTWLVGNYGHAREHVGHIQLTRQLYASVRPS